MSVSIGIKREFELTGNDLEGDGCLFPRDPSNHVFAQAFNFRTKLIAKSASNYLAFPYVIQLGSSLVGIYSDGESHANSDKQIMVRSDDGGLTWSSVDFYVNATATYNFSLLNGILASGSKAVFKSWTVTNTAGSFSAVINSTVTNGGDTYAIWSRPVNAPSSKLFRTGYTTTGDWKTALLESSDSGSTWTFTSDIFSQAGKTFSEADIVNTSGNNWLAIAREDTGSSNPLFWSTSANSGSTWSTPAQLPTSKLNGRQPNIIKLANGDIIISTGDRSGTSGFAGSGGALSYFGDTTGVAVAKLPAPTACGSNPFTTPLASTAKIRLTLTSHGFQTGDLVFIEGATGPIDGIPASEINGFRTVTRISGSVVEFDTTTNATAGSVTGGGSSVTVSLFGWRTRISPVFSTDGGQPFANEISAGRISVVYYARRTTRTKPVIASATLNTTNL